MASCRAVFPALPPPSFPPVTLLPATRCTGATVVFPDTMSPVQGDTATEDSRKNQILDRRSSGDGNILCIDDTQYFWLQRILRSTTTNGKIRAGFCLKAPNKGHGSKASAIESNDAVWEVEVVNPSNNARAKDGTDDKSETQVQMVAIRIEDAKDFMDSPELAALSYVASNAITSGHVDTATTTTGDVEDENEYIQNALLVASDESKVYVVMPYDIATSISLLDYSLAQQNATIPESQAREFTKQILKVCSKYILILPLSLLSWNEPFLMLSFLQMKGIEMLQNMKLCHRNLTLDSIVVRPKKKRHGTTTDDDPVSCLYCTIRNFDNAVRVPYSTSTDEDGTTTNIKVHMMTLAPLQAPPVRTKGNWNIQFVAPEVLNSSRNYSNSKHKDTDGENGSQPHGPFDGYAMDLWAVGVMILSMLLGNDKIFVAPILEDRIFQQISVQGQLKEYYDTGIVSPPMTTTTTDTFTAGTPRIISDNALDLVQQMLRYDPNDRPTLRDIQQHPWLKGK